MPPGKPIEPPPLPTAPTFPTTPDPVAAALAQMTTAVDRLATENRHLSQRMERLEDRPATRNPVAPASDIPAILASLSPHQMMNDAGASTLAAIQAGMTMAGNQTGMVAQLQAEGMTALREEIQEIKEWIMEDDEINDDEEEETVIVTFRKAIRDELAVAMPKIMQSLGNTGTGFVDAINDAVQNPAILETQDDDGPDPS